MLRFFSYFFSIFKDRVYILKHAKKLLSLKLLQIRNCKKSLKMTVRMFVNNKNMNSNNYIDTALIKLPLT